MRWTILDFAIVIALWAIVLRIPPWSVRLTASASPREVRSHQLERGGVICAATGVTFVVVWFITDIIGLHWLHAFSRPAALTFIAGAAALSGYAAWVRTR